MMPFTPDYGTPFDCSGDVIMKADLHIHSIHSPDAIARPRSILAAAADRGIGIIAITDHDTAAGWRDFAALAQRYPVAVVPGQEMRVYRDREVVGELLCLFLEKPVAGRTVNEILDQVRAQGGMVSIAHPFSERRVEFRAFDEITTWAGVAIEVLNGRSYKPRDNEMARNLARRLGLPMTAGSDAHTPFEIGNAYVEFSGSCPDALKKALINGDVEIKGRPSSILFSLLSGFGRLGVTV